MALAITMPALILTSAMSTSSAVVRPPASFSTIPSSAPSSPPRLPLPLPPPPSPPQQQQPLPPPAGGAAADLVTLVPDLIPLLRTVTAFLAGRPSFLEDLATAIIGLGQILAAPFPAQTRGLINTATDLLGGLSPLLQFVAQIDFARITTSLKGLFDPDFIEGAVRMIKEVSGVITTEFVTQIVQIVRDIAPLISAMSEFLTALIASLIR
ncbi:hypothetical protein Micbo1qcDRAFT_179343 [Microdochium bolleyi]|uniref:Uncharacterized protein n=1 Tax=Microdochium bolleyi TaxID=196109 RepID=A0A136IQ96_9PEZI|nr:hypothetical protein Micbo1qcDRAFT_179343 [Microdochium bolleyi]